MDNELARNIADNINKLLIFWDLNVRKLSEKTGLSASGIYKTLKDGIFKLDALIKIAESLNVPLFILIADEISIEKEATGEGYMITINYHFKETSQFQVLNDGKKLTTQFLIKGNYFGVDEAKFKELETKVQTMELAIERKDETIAHLNEKATLYKEQADTLKNLFQSLLDKTPKNPE